MRTTGKGSLMSEVHASISPEDLADLDLTDATKQYLRHHGLPQVDSANDRPFGLSFCKPFAYQIGRRRYVVFAREEWAPELYLAIKSGADRIVAPAGPLDRGDVYVNANINDFIDFYQRASPLWAQAEALSPAVRSDHRSREEVQASIRELQEKYRTGELRGEPDPREAALTAATKELKAYMKSVDPRAPRGGSWWGRAMEALED